MSLFEFTDYKLWVQSHLQTMPKSGRGQLRKIAEHLRVNPTIITQVFSGPRDLTPEQALLLADYFALGKAETRFLIALVHFARAGTQLYRQSLLEEIHELRERFREISTRVRQNAVLSDDAKAVLYSNWYYLAVWSLTAIESFNNAEVIAERLGLPLRRIREAVDFLIKHGLVIADENELLRVGPTLVHLESTSPQIPRHHQNWRLQAFRHYERPGAEDAFYTAPVTLSAADAKRLREHVITFIARSVSIIKDSPSEKLYCLNIDWFEV